MRRVMLTLSTVLLFVAFTLAGCETTKTTTRPSGTTTTTTTPPTTVQQAPATTAPAPATK